MPKKHKRGRPSRTPVEDLAKWHEDMAELRNVLGGEFVAKNLKSLQTAPGRSQLLKTAKELREDSKKVRASLSGTRFSSDAAKCAKKWTKHHIGVQDAEAEAIELLVDAFKHGHPQKGAKLLLTQLLQEAVQFKAKEPKNWRVRFQANLHRLELEKHNQPEDDGTVLFATTPQGSHPDYSIMTFNQGIIRFIGRQTGYSLSTRSVFREIRRLGLSARK